MMKNQQTDLNGRKIKVMRSQIRQIQIKTNFEPGSPVIVLYKYSLDAPFQACIIGNIPYLSKRVNGTGTAPISFQLKYSTLIPVVKELKTNILKLCEAMAIHPNFHKSYSDMTCSDQLLEI